MTFLATEGVLGGVAHFPQLAEREAVFNYVLGLLSGESGSRILEHWHLDQEFGDVLPRLIYMMDEPAAGLDPAVGRQDFTFRDHETSAGLQLTDVGLGEIYTICNVKHRLVINEH